MSKTLLVVDDAMIIRTMIKDTVEELGWTVVGEAPNGGDAVELYESLRPDAVTLDLVMPELDGLHALQGILEIDPDAKVVVVSAINQKSILQRALLAGAADFVVKPFDPHDLKSALEQLHPEAANTA